MFRDKNGKVTFKMGRPFTEAESSTPIPSNSTPVSSSTVSNKNVLGNNEPTKSSTVIPNPELLLKGVNEKLTESKTTTSVPTSLEEKSTTVTPKTLGKSTATEIPLQNNPHKMNTSSGGDLKKIVTTFSPGQK